MHGLVVDMRATASLESYRSQSSGSAPGSCTQQPLCWLGRAVVKLDSCISTMLLTSGRALCAESFLWTEFTVSTWVQTYMPLLLPASVIAQLALTGFGTLLSDCRRLPEYTESMNRLQWRSRARLPGFNIWAEVSHRTLSPCSA